MVRGNVLIGQSGGPTSVINASLYGVIRSCLDSSPSSRILGMRFGIEGFLAGNVVDLGMQSPGELARLLKTPSSALGSCRYKLVDEDLERILEAFRKLDVRTCIMIGGNDTMETVHRVARHCVDRGFEVSGLGVPKTVDNDLYGTDHTPGFPSAARFTALSVQQSGRLACDMQSVDRFVVHQTVGRDAGWLAASSAAARLHEGDAPHIVCIPERPIDPAQIVQDVRSVIDEYGWAYVVVGEGTLWSDGTPVSSARVRDGFANLEFGAMSGASAALQLHGLITRETGYRGEFQITESLSMCAVDRTSAIDVREAFECGKQALRMAEAGEGGVMVSLVREPGPDYRVRLGSIPLEDVAGNTRPMPDEFIHSNGHDVTGKFLDYLRPLVGELDDYSRLDFSRVR